MNTKHNFLKKALACITTLMLVFSAGPYLPVQDNASVACAAQIKLNARNITLQKGRKKTLKLKNVSGKVSWKSSKKSVASVSKKGVVTAKKPGKAIITALYGNKKYKCTVTVLTENSGSSGGKTKNGSSGGTSKNGNSGGTVYWTPSGGVYHVSRNCPTLSRSKTVYSGTPAASGKGRSCKVCS